MEDSSELFEFSFGDRRKISVRNKNAVTLFIPRLVLEERTQETRTQEECSTCVAEAAEATPVSRGGHGHAASGRWRDKLAWWGGGGMASSAAGR